MNHAHRPFVSNIIPTLFDTSKAAHWVPAAYNKPTLDTTCFVDPSITF